MSRTLITNATVWTGHRLPDGTIHTSDSVLFDAGRIISLGASARRGGADVVLDAGGEFIAPAFADGHVHPIFGGLEREFAAVRDATSTEEITAAVGVWARAHPNVEWVRGEGFDPSLAPEGIFLATWLDAVVPDRPVALRASDYHTVWVNSEALRRANYGPGVVQPLDGEIVLDNDGLPTGTLREWGAWRPVYALMPEVPEHILLGAIDVASRTFAAAGITWVQDAWVEVGDVSTWLRAAEAGLLLMTVDMALWADPTAWRNQLSAFTEARSRVTAAGFPTLSCRTVKFFADGVVESGTSAMLQPFCDCPHSLGLPNWNDRELNEAVAAVDLLGFTPHIHAIGDLGIRMALNAIEYTAVSNPSRDRRWVIAHTQLVDPEDLPRFSELGVIANFEPYWSQWDPSQSTLTAPKLGPERTHRQYQTASLANLGTRISFGSDWPVTTHEPLRGIHMAVTRQAHVDGKSWMPEERISVDDALLAYTSGVAFQAGREDAGVIRPGAIADLVWLSSDPRRVSPTMIDSLSVRSTWRHGLRTFPD
jgi:predicted amidohydrolase YtcJ